MYCLLSESNLFQLRIVRCLEKKTRGAAAVAAFNKAFVAWWYQWSQCPGGSNPTIQPTKFWPYHEWKLPTYHSVGIPEHFWIKWGTSLCWGWWVKSSPDWNRYNQGPLEQWTEKFLALSLEISKQNTWKRIQNSGVIEHKIFANKTQDADILIK